jgi:beta-glucosidase
MFKKISLFLGFLVFGANNSVQSVPYWDWNSKNMQSMDFPSNFNFGASIFANESKGYEHWDRYRQDAQRAKEVGLTELCFSLDWSIIEPAPGVFNEDALQHYADFCVALIRNGVEPVIILKDYNDPAWFLQSGGFEKSKNIALFERYCLRVFRTLSGKAYRFITFWNPESYAMLAYWNKSHAPYKKDMKLAMTVFKNQLEAHVQVYHALKKADDEKKIQIGIAKHVIQLEPKFLWDKWAASMADTLTNNPFYKFFTTGKFKVSVHLPKKWGGVSVSYKNHLAPHSIDFVGINYHCHNHMRNFKRIPFSHEPKTDIESITVYPEGLYYAIKEVSDKMASKLNIPIIITQNGIATTDDKLRRFHNERNLFAVSEAIKDGYNVQGYYHYSLLDGFAWGSYAYKFGLFSVEPTTMERTLKPGASRFVEIAQKHKKMHQQ